jgi:hypothetical protein
LDKARNFYGAALDGVDLSCALAGASGCGVVFKLHPAGKETVLYIFKVAADGGSLRQDLAWSGMRKELSMAVPARAASSGACHAGFNENFGCGTVFQVNKTGKLTVLHRFRNDGAEGVGQNGGLVRDPAGDLYAITQEAWLSGNFGGAIFKVSKTRGA